MARRLALFLVIGALVAIPGVSPAAPMGGIVRVFECFYSANPDSTCPVGPDESLLIMTFNGSLSLNGGTYSGVFRVAAVARPGAGLAWRFDNAPVNGPAVFEVPPEFAPGYLSGGPKIWGSCGGQVIAQTLVRLGCSFQTENGLSGYRDLIVAYVYDAQMDLYSLFPETPGGPPCDCRTSTGVFTRDFVKSL